MHIGLVDVRKEQRKPKLYCCQQQQQQQEKKQQQEQHQRFDDKIKQKLIHNNSRAIATHMTIINYSEVGGGRSRLNCA
ncbi:hypothetical protein AWZ03_010977 [Drosophila navojoa]|uniref:Uncharacterized protein n=1 Tax=Drosophila navojoa TaxID=7232 RepID=A0A484B1L0_DRONA|nr:hypothetical protein AWZ03_010977 [Drosophila navojoa]